MVCMNWGRRPGGRVRWLVEAQDRADFRLVFLDKRMRPISK
jgi:hypothetical protein